MLKGSDGMNPDDPTVITENELLSAASAIDADAQRLAQLKLRKSKSDDHAQFDELIVEACKSITAATSALVKAALSAQRELVSTGKNNGRPLSTSDDRQWSEGVVSAARLVALATHSLYESVNVFAKGGQATEEQFISFAKQVANSTAQLSEAFKVKADQDSSGMKKLQVARNAVEQATDNLVEAVQKAVEKELFETTKNQFFFQ